MTSTNIYHYVYRITNLVSNKHYYGKRSSKNEPHLDIGKKYFSSSKDKQFIQDQKEHPQNFKYKIIMMFESSRKACEFESRLHYKFDVGNNVNFYNRVKQTANGFDSTGKTIVKDEFDNHFMVSINDPRFLSGELISLTKNKVAVKDNFGKCFLIPKNDPRYLNKELIPISVGRKISDEQKKKLSIKMKGRIKSTETCKKISETQNKNKSHVGSNNSRFKYFYHTPWGIYDSPAALEPNFSMTKMKNFCINNNRILSKLVYKNSEKLKNTFNESCIGKTYAELGFGVNLNQKGSPPRTFTTANACALASSSAS